MRPLIAPEITLTETQKRILVELRIKGPTPRMVLARELGINTATITRVIQQLTALGLVEERDGSQSTERGRPSVPLAVSGKGAWAVGATVHPGWLELAIVDFSGALLVHDAHPFTDPDPRTFARTIDARLRELAATHGVMRGRFLGVGIAVPGYALRGDRNRRKVVDWLPPWNDAPLDDVIGDVLGMPVWIENEGTAAALAEYYQSGVIGQHRSVLVLFLGHGFGGGVVADRDLFSGEHANAGEVGRLFPGNGPRPSGIDLMATLKRSGVSIDSLAELADMMPKHPDIFEAWTARAAVQIEQAIISGVAWLDPGAVVLSGALPLPLLDDLTARVRILSDERNSGYFAEKPVILASSIGSKAVVVGAAMGPISAVTAKIGSH